MAEIHFVSSDDIPERAKDILVRAVQRAGILDEQWEFRRLDSDFSGAKILVPVGEEALQKICSKESITKWHCSILKSRIEYGGVKAIPLLHPSYVFRHFTESAYLAFGALRIKEELAHPSFFHEPRDFRLNPSFEDTLALIKLAYTSDWLSLDVETGRGQINTFGFSFIPRGGKMISVAVQVLPERLGDEKFHQLWKAIAGLCESPIPKILQNFIYDTLFLSRYGIHVNAIWHDTMWANKFLEPELEAGLHNVGRLYTRYPYWKDDGKDWNDIRDWVSHFEYNCKDHGGALTAFFAQVEDLKERGLYDLFRKFVMHFAGPIREMCTRGLCVDEEVRHAFRNRYESEAAHLMNLIKGEIGDVNPRSTKQLKAALKAHGIQLPFVKKKGQEEAKESVDKKQLIKLKKRYPKKPVLDYLIKLSAKNKMLSSYVNFGISPDGKVRYQLNGCATETGRWNSTLDPWGCGFNVQTVPKAMRKMFRADPGKMLVEIDLAKAESYYVAWESPEPKLMELLDSGGDIHRYVAAKTFGIQESNVTDGQRQLGKKSGHAANYGVGPNTFADQCLYDLDLHISQGEAKRIIDGYFTAFPGIKQRQLNIQQEIRNKKKLRTPLGRERTFYDRIGDSLFREAYAYCPQSTVPDIINHLMLHLFGRYDLLAQIHDSLLLQVEPERIETLADEARNLSLWHPKIELPGGSLQIPVDVKCGENWLEMRKV